MLAGERGGDSARKGSDQDFRRQDLPLDRVHLTRQCQGDAELEDSLLRLFRQQAPILMAQLASPCSPPAESKSDLAHRLRGSALSVGARRVAKAAALVEESARRDFASESAPALAQAVAELKSAVDEAIVEIGRICR